MGTNKLKQAGSQPGKEMGGGRPRLPPGKAQVDSWRPYLSEGLFHSVQCLRPGLPRRNPGSLKSSGHQTTLRLLGDGPQPFAAVCLGEDGTGLLEAHEWKRWPHES